MLLEASQTGPSSISCAVCFEEYVESDTVIILPCHPSHRFHRICLRVKSLFFIHSVPSKSR
jgi:uncharacterized protein (DUF362 family)